MPQRIEYQNGVFVLQHYHHGFTRFTKPGVIAGDVEQVACIDHDAENGKGTTIHAEQRTECHLDAAASVRERTHITYRIQRFRNDKIIHRRCTSKGRHFVSLHIPHRDPIHILYGRCRVFDDRSDLLQRLLVTFLDILFEAQPQLRATAYQSHLILPAFINLDQIPLFTFRQGIELAYGYLLEKTH